MKLNKHVLVLSGSGNGEDLPSKMTSQHVGEYLASVGAKATFLEFNKSTFYQDIVAIKPDIVFNAMHGVYGEDGRIQGILDLLEIPYTHDNHYVASVGFNKDYTKRIMVSANIPTAKWILVDRDEVLSGEYLKKASDFITNGYVLKPNCSGSTLGLCIRKKDKIHVPITENELSNDDEFIIEKFIDGSEFVVLVLNKKIIGGIDITSNGDENIITYEDKYINICPRNQISADEELLDQLHKHSLNLVKTLNLNTVARVDFRVEDLKIFTLEVNTQPGMGKSSMVNNICQYSNFNIFQIFEYLILNAKFLK